MRKAVLIIHGFAGGTYDEEKLAFYLELQRKLDVYQFTLPGHAKNLSKVRYEEWINKSEEMLNLLINNGYSKIYLIGHSMGGVIATYLGAKYKQVKKLVLAAPAFHYLKISKNDINIQESLKEIPGVFKIYGGDEIVARFLKLNVSATIEFSSLIKELYDYPKEITCPVLLIHGNDDTLIPVSSSRYVYNNIKSKNKTLYLMDNVTHDIFRSNRVDEANKIVKNFLMFGLKNGINNI